MPGPTLILPLPSVAAVAIISLLQNRYLLDAEEANKLEQSNEPYRTAAHLLGWGDADGSEWWDVVMDLIG